jgi:hypothetical protein
VLAAQKEKAGQLAARPSTSSSLPADYNPNAVDVAVPVGSEHMYVYVPVVLL